MKYINMIVLAIRYLIISLLRIKFLSITLTMLQLSTTVLIKEVETAVIRIFTRHKQGQL